MCPPVIAGIGLAMSIAGAAASMVQGKQQAKFQQAQLKEQANTEEAAAALRQEDRNNRMKALIADNLSRYSAAGVDNSVGSPVDVAADTAGQFAKEQFADSFDVDNSVRTASLQSSVSKQNGNTNAVNSLFDIGSKVASLQLSGISQG